MNGLSSLRIGSALVLGFCLGLAGCTPAPSVAPAPAPTPVMVSYPVERDVTDYGDFTGRTAAVDSVEVRARVWGYLDKVNFSEGALVKKGDVLFEIDPRTYQAALHQAEGNLASVEARLKRLDGDLARAQQLVGKGAMSREEHDRIAGDRGETAASIRALQAAVGRAKLDLAFTKVTAPISGRVSRYNVTVGNLVQSGDQGGGTVLTTIVSVDPVYVYFDVDERTVLRVRQLIREGKAKSARETEWPVSLGLSADEGYPHQGTIDFVDNQVNPRTGTLRVRAIFPNKDEAISPGFFARVRVPVGFPRQALLVTDRAIDNDQGQKILYVVNDNNEVASRPIRVGALHDGLRAIEDGLRPGEPIIVTGLQQVRPGVTVEPKLVDMPVAPAARARTETAQILKPAGPAPKPETR
jgi:membrane fusion protein, multidrug efflux system